MLLALIKILIKLQMIIFSINPINMQILQEAKWISTMAITTLWVYSHKTIMLLSCYGNYTNK